MLGIWINKQRNTIMVVIHSFEAKFPLSLLKFVSFWSSSACFLCSCVMLWIFTFIFFVSCCSGRSGSCSLLFFLFGEDSHHTLLEVLPLHLQPVLVPDEVWLSDVKSISLTAPFKQVVEVFVVWISNERETSAVHHVVLKLYWLVHAQFINCNFLLLSLDVVIFLLLWSSRQALPWQRSLQKVQQDMTNCFQVITSWLLVAYVRVDGGVPSSACQVLALSEGDVFTLWVLVALGQTKVNDVDVVLSVRVAANKEVVRFYVTMDDSLFMHFLDAKDLVTRNTYTQIITAINTSPILAISSNLIRSWAIQNWRIEFNQIIQVTDN